MIRYRPLTGGSLASYRLEHPTRWAAVRYLSLGLVFTLVMALWSVAGEALRDVDGRSPNEVRVG